ncbi:MAG: exodeoxyribonuclease III [Candidatus Brocadiia bacterium]|nr:MAG: exodeoxyribonuclease III [Candidatus Brocadiia bacterium]
MIIPWLEKNQPDVLAVQETKVQDEDFPTKDFDNIGYNYAFKGQKSYNGVAIFSKTAIINPNFGFDDEPHDQPRLITANIENIFIVNTYVPQGDSPESEKFAYKLKWFHRLRKYFEKNFTPKDPVIWLGDLNIAPEPKDVYDPISLQGHVCFHPDVQKALQNVMEWGFVDVFRMHNSEPGQYTFWDYRMRGSFKRNLGWRIDHIMASESLAKRTSACYIDKNPRHADRPSDHTPIIAQFD